MQFPIVNSITNRFHSSFGTTGAATAISFAKAVNSPVSTVTSDVSQGCIIQAVHVSVDGCGLAGTGVLNVMGFYLMKNPGNNLTPPSPFATGSSNEKKFIFRQWNYMIMRNQDGNAPFHWEGWIPIPKKYQRMGTDDTIQLIHINSAAVTGHMTIEMIYKWKR